MTGQKCVSSQSPGNGGQGVDGSLFNWKMFYSPLVPYCRPDYSAGGIALDLRDTSKVAVICHSVSRYLGRGLLTFLVQPYPMGNCLFFFFF